MDTPPVLEGAEEFNLGDGPVGALLVHGFTGSPQGLRGLGDYLAERNVAVEGIRLPGHGTTWQDLDARQSDEWVTAVQQGFSKISRGRTASFVVGLSFGAALALDFAARNPEPPEGVVGIATFLGTKDPRRFLAPIIARLIKSLPGVGSDIADPAMVELAYDRLPTTATLSMLRLCRRTKAELHRVRCPVLLMHSHHDHTAPPTTPRFIYDKISSGDKEIVWVDNSYHVLTLDVDREQVFKRTYDFIAARSPLLRDR
jgi:carboxylesterase